jgi:hypothetical protein
MADQWCREAILLPEWAQFESRHQFLSPVLAVVNEEL